jgi:uncharacterized repeat protein (TIGR02543 family)
MITSFFYFILLLVVSYFFPVIGYIAFSMVLIFFLFSIIPFFTSLRGLFIVNKTKIKCPKCSHDIYYKNDTNYNGFHYCIDCKALFKVDDDFVYSYQQAWNTYILSILGLIIHIIKLGHDGKDEITKREEEFLLGYVGFLKQEGIKGTYIAERFEEFYKGKEPFERSVNNLKYYSKEFPDGKEKMFEFLIKAATLTSEINPEQMIFLFDMTQILTINFEWFDKAVEKHHYKHNYIKVGKDLLVILNSLLRAGGSITELQQKMMNICFVTYMMLLLKGKSNQEEAIKKICNEYDNTTITSEVFEMSTSRFREFLRHYKIEDDFIKQIDCLVEEMNSNQKQIMTYLEKVLKSVPDDDLQYFIEKDKYDSEVDLEDVHQFHTAEEDDSIQSRDDLLNQTIKEDIRDSQDLNIKSDHLTVLDEESQKVKMIKNKNPKKKSTWIIQGMMAILIFVLFINVLKIDIKFLRFDTYTASKSSLITMRFDSKGGSNIASISGEPGSSVQMPKPSRYGYEFEGWFTDSYLSKRFNASKMPNEDITLYAKWSTANNEPVQATLRFNSNGGSSVANIIKAEGSYISLPTPTRSGYEFKGWYENQSLTLKFNKSTMPSTSFTLYAKWEEKEVDDKPPVQQYKTLTFHSNGGSIVSSVIELSGTSITLPEPTKRDYKFMGWFEEQSFTTRFDDSVMPNQNKTLYAKWGKIYDITYSYKIGSSNMAKIGKYAEGETLKLFIPTSTTRYTFVGWYEDSAFTREFTRNTMPNQDIRIFGKFDVKEEYILTFNSNNGSEVSPIEKLPGEPISLPTPTRSGYKFEGWYVNANFTAKFTDTVMPNQDRTLYAKWTKETINATGNLSIKPINAYYSGSQLVFNAYIKNNTNVDVTGFSHVYLVVKDANQNVIATGYFNPTKTSANIDINEQISWTFTFNSSAVSRYDGNFSYIYCQYEIRYYY